MGDGGRAWLPFAESLLHWLRKQLRGYFKSFDSDVALQSAKVDVFHYVSIATIARTTGVAPHLTGTNGDSGFAAPTAALAVLCKFWIA